MLAYVDFRTNLVHIGTKDYSKEKIEHWATVFPKLDMYQLEPYSRTFDYEKYIDAEGYLRTEYEKADSNAVEEVVARLYEMGPTKHGGHSKIGRESFYIYLLEYDAELSEIADRGHIIVKYVSHSLASLRKLKEAFIACIAKKHSIHRVVLDTGSNVVRVGIRDYTMENITAIRADFPESGMYTIEKLLTNGEFNDTYHIH